MSEIQMIQRGGRFHIKLENLERATEALFTLARVQNILGRPEERNIIELLWMFGWGSTLTAGRTPETAKGLTGLVGLEWSGENAIPENCEQVLRALGPFVEPGCYLVMVDLNDEGPKPPGNWFRWSYDKEGKLVIDEDPKMLWPPLQNPMPEVPS